ncbi:MAG: hypothetical protein LH468_03275 [Nocardioides sp.]|nr:hypothetical protein [Nocardioides sp.]
MRRTTSPATVVLWLSLLGALLGGCGSASEPTGPTGVDELVIPTPSPAPSDFVEVIDNRWLAWEPGATATYQRVGTGVAGTPSPLEDTTVTTRVGNRTVVVAGLAATTLTTTTPEGVSTDWFAQDSRSNVWWLGRAGEWRAGLDGAQAGLFMPADPRVGDGYRAAEADGVVDQRVEVVEVVEVPSTGTRTRTETETETGILRLEVRSALAPGVVDQQTYVVGRGLTRTTRTTAAPGSSYVLELAGF